MSERFENFTSSIININRCINRIKSSEMTEFGLKGNHTMCIYHLAKHPVGLTCAKLSEFCDEDKAAISRSISFLESNDFVISNSDKKYRASYTLTEKGKHVSERINSAIENILDSVGSFLTEQQRIDFYNSLDTIAKRLDDICK